jgi:MoaA/NifB/PqqE/SkfB family radical SAM enzyme
VTPKGVIYPCCSNDYTKPMGNTKETSLKDAFNSDPMKQLRLDMLNEKKNDICNFCYKHEEAGPHSFRNYSKEHFAKHFDEVVPTTQEDGTVEEFKMRYFDIRFSNICNFKCRSCSSTYSSSWATEDNKQGQNKSVFIFAGGNNNDLLYEQIKPYISEVKEIYFAGGEPLLMDKHYDILKHLIDIDNTDIKIRYNTNLSSLAFKNISVIDLWKKFSNVHLNVSLDSWGDRAEYIREGTEWKTIIDNINTVKTNCPHIHLGVSSVISAFNVYTLPEFTDYLLDNRLFEASSISFYNLIHPNFYSFDIFDTETKTEIIKKLSERNYNNSIRSRINNVIRHLESSTSNDELRRQFKDQTNHYDSIRNKQFTDIFPELKDFYENIL